MNALEIVEEDNCEIVDVDEIEIWFLEELYTSLFI